MSTTDGVRGNGKSEQGRGTVMKRKNGEVEHEKGMLSRRVKVDRSVTLALSNIGSDAKAFDLTERVPVSEVEQVKIEFDAEKTCPPASPDENGFVTWKVELPPGGHEEIRLRYVVEKHTSVAGI